MRKMILAACAAVLLVGSLSAHAESYRAAVHQARVAARIERAELRGLYGSQLGLGAGGIIPPPIGIANPGFIPPPPPPPIFGGAAVETLRLRPHVFRFR